jgi:hypothetical protein
MVFKNAVEGMTLSTHVEARKQIETLKMAVYVISTTCQWRTRRLGLLRPLQRSLESRIRSDGEVADQSDNSGDRCRAIGEGMREIWQV